MEEYTINLYPIFRTIVILFAIVGGYNLLNNVAHLLARVSKDKLDNKKDIHAKDCDTDVMQDLIMKYPLVDKDFMGKTAKEMNIENNQEIQEHNIKLQEILGKLEILQRDMDEVRRIQRGGLWYTHSNPCVSF